MKRLLYFLLLLLLAPPAIGASQQFEGDYRFGHEVNTVCTGEPEKCYWLVDTAKDIRQQLKQRVSGLEPYTPVCLQLEAELSTRRADGFGADYDGSIRVLKILGECTGELGKVTAIKVITINDLQHRRWILQRVDELTLTEFAIEAGFESEASLGKIPELDFGQHGYVSGNAGCNDFQGQAQVIDNNLILTQLAISSKLCNGFAGELELQLLLLYRNPLAISFDGNGLMLVATDRRLYFKRRDWVQ